MKIEIWSDIYCPFCYIGEQHLKAALEKFPQAHHIQVVYKSFQLDPSLEKGQAKETASYVAEKYGIRVDQARLNYQGIEAAGKAVGLEMDFEAAIITNTLDSHRLIHWAAEKGYMQEMVDRLFKAHFEEGLHLGEYQVLADLAGQIGLDEEEALEVLESGAYADQVAADEAEGQALGVTSVPFFVFNRELAITGAQPTAVFEEAIETAFGLKKGLKLVRGNENRSCGPEGCRIN